MTMETQTKKCSKCGEVKSVSEFSKGHYWCKCCRRDDYKKYYENNLEKIKAARVKYRENNHEKCLLRESERREKYPEKIKAINAKYRENNSEKIKIRAAKYRENNPEKIKATNAKHNTKKSAKARSLINLVLYSLGLNHQTSGKLDFLLLGARQLIIMQTRYNVPFSLCQELYAELFNNPTKETLVNLFIKSGEYKNELHS